MDKIPHASIDIGKLAGSLRGKFEALRPLSEKCCIYRIPQRFRQLNEQACTPRAVSIGPFHNGIKKLEVMEEYKVRYLRDFLQRTEVRIEKFLEYIRDREEELRECYAETIKSPEFVEMILVDSAFLIELLLKNFLTQFREPRGSVKYDIWPDIWKLENQLPMFILKGLFELAMSATPTNRFRELSLGKLIYFLLRSRAENLLIKEDVVENNLLRAQHLLDLLRLCLQPPELEPQSYDIPVSTPTITELQRAGVKFESSSSEHLFDIKFTNGILKFPEWIISNKTESLFMNLEAFEQLHCSTLYVNDYIALISRLINTRKDEDILIREGIIKNLLWDNEGGTALFRNLVKESLTCGFYYSDLVKQLEDYCRKPSHRWKANLKQNYFNTPWSSISVIAAIILLILTVIQAACAMVELWRH